ncbi:hypothetical protein SELMODRAFT_411309 [Selaginella moellendorffii]|uniref:Uncharacterized protein n=1 Tax=Selaginella moellendorffii TaxID=88036 RepID=D8RH82_SELML|nr:hypothetical protein SELMODRAFT_411309 [Selaginella moellendorffii]
MGATPTVDFKIHPTGHLRRHDQMKRVWAEDTFKRKDYARLRDRASTVFRVVMLEMDGHRADLETARTRSGNLERRSKRWAVEVPLAHQVWPPQTEVRQIRVLGHTHSPAQHAQRKTSRKRTYSHRRLFDEESRTLGSSFANWGVYQGTRSCPDLGGLGGSGLSSSGTRGLSRWSGLERPLLSL